MLARKLAEFERREIESALEAEQGRVADAARLLKIPRRTLYDKLARYGIDARSFRRCADSCNRVPQAAPANDDSCSESQN